MLRKQKAVINRRLLILVFILTLLGLIAVADASAPQALSVFHDKYYYIKQQLVWAFLGLVAMVFAALVPYRLWAKIAPILFYANVILLIVVLIPGLGTKVLGARRWLILGPISIQPSEMIKFTLTLYLAKLAEEKRSILAYLIPLFGISLLTMLQPDLGTTLVFLGIGFVIMFTSGVNIWYFLAAGLIGSVLSFLTIFFSEYRRLRLLTFLKQTSDPLGSSYHIRQILFSLSLGGLWGVGLGASRQKYLFLPETTTDSIFAVLAEEVGFIGSIILLLLFVLLLYECFRVAYRTSNVFARTVVLGITAWIGFQTFLNIGSMVALVPLTGVPLPFFSYGGSSLMMILLSMGIILNISRYSLGHEKR